MKYVLILALALSGCATMSIKTPDGCAVCSVRSFTLLGDTALTATTTINAKTGVSQESCDTPGQSANGLIASLAAAGVLAGAGGLATPMAVRTTAPTSCGG